MGFEQEFKNAVENKIEADDDRYIEIKYSNTIYIHVASVFEGENGDFEIEAIVPHHNVQDKPSKSTLNSDDIPDVDQLYSDLEQYLEDVTGKSYDLVFHCTAVVDDGAWKRDATVYSTFSLEA